MGLTIEPGARVSERDCPDCGQPFQRVAGYVSCDGDRYATYIASCYHHDGHEAYFDVVFSPTWASDVDDHETFGCRVGLIPGTTGLQASLTPAASPFPDSTLFGRKLNRDEALEHPRLTDFWAVVDHLLENDPVVRKHIYGEGAVVEAT